MVDWDHLFGELGVRWPHPGGVATTPRTVRTATMNDWGAIGWSADGFVEATHRPGLEILDRVGGETASRQA